MQENNLTFAKIVSNPTTLSWSQAYNAGKLFAVLSLVKSEENIESDFLNLLGKDVLETLEQEFFTLETKDLASIKNAVLVTAKKIPEDVICSFVTGAVVDKILYIFILGHGKVDIKRQDNLGTVLQSVNENPKEIKTGSGILQDNDLIILQTKQFSDVVTTSELVENIDNQTPEAIAEAVAPIIHKKEEGGAASIIIKYKEAEKDEEDEENLENKQESALPASSLDSESEDKEIRKETADTFETSLPAEKENKLNSGMFKNYLSLVLQKTKFLKISRLNHSKRLYLTIGVILVAVFLASIFLAIKKQNDAKTKVAFSEIYLVAQKKYDEGQNLTGLNENLARNSFSTAQKILEDGKSKFSPNSSEEKQILELLGKVNKALAGVSGVSIVKAKEVDKDSSKYLSFEIDNSKAISFSQDDNNIYVLDGNGISSQAKSEEESKVVIKKDELESSALALNPYLSNIYVLNKNNSISKFIGLSSGFVKSDYFPEGTSPDFSKATAMTINGSVFVLLKDGTILKFTKGIADNFSVSGLDKGFSNPSKIYTNADIDNLYILDNGNSRIVVLDANGVYKSEYQASLLKTAKDFDVLEKDKKIYFLSGGKIYEIGLK